VKSTSLQSGRYSRDMRISCSDAKENLIIFSIKDIVFIDIVFLWSYEVTSNFFDSFELVLKPIFRVFALHSNDHVFDDFVDSLRLLDDLFVFNLLISGLYIIIAHVNDVLIHSLHIDVKS
jgi:hypothetical protein